jgi:large subunit ribosomal protein L15
MKTKKRKKASRMRGRGMGTHGWGARKKHKKSGHRGGKGKAGTGKRGDQKKTQITKLYGHKYFGKRGITSKKTIKDKRLRINLLDIESNPKKYGEKKGDTWEIDLSSYKILGNSDEKSKLKLIIKAKEASKAARKKVEKRGGKIILPRKKEERDIE